MNVLIDGEAGQGLVTVGQLLAKSLVRSGYSILVTLTYQSRIRGGHNSFAIHTATDGCKWGDLGRQAPCLDATV
jgi:2-oxoglutarate ferredoxin oxidoreductase subunit alpha